MLVLSRKLNEEIRINSEIIIKVIGISENSIKIGIVAPKEVEILRGELYEKVKENAIIATKKAKQKIDMDLDIRKVNKIKK